MAIVQVQTRHDVGGVSPLVSTFSVAPTSGNLMVATLVTTTAVTATFDTPAGWTMGRLENQAMVLWKVSDGSETVQNFTWAGAPACRAFRVELSGAHATTPIDSTGYTVFSGAVTSVACITDAVAGFDGEYGIAMAGHNASNGGGETASDSYTLMDTGNVRDIGASRVYVGGVGGSVTTTLGWTTAQAGRWIIASIRPPGGGGPPAVGANPTPKRYGRSRVLGR